MDENKLPSFKERPSTKNIGRLLEVVGTIATLIGIYGIGNKLARTGFFGIINKLTIFHKNFWFLNWKLLLIYLLLVCSGTPLVIHGGKSLKSKDKRENPLPFIIFS